MSDKDPGIRARRGRAEVSGERKEEKYGIVTLYYVSEGTNYLLGSNVNLPGCQVGSCSTARMVLKD